MNVSIYNYFLKLIRTKKTLHLLNKEHKIVFQVNNCLKKKNIKYIIENIFQVNIKSINICHYNMKNYYHYNVNKKVKNKIFKKVYISLKNDFHINKYNV